MKFWSVTFLNFLQCFSLKLNNEIQFDANKDSKINGNCAERFDTGFPGSVQSYIMGCCPPPTAQQPIFQAPAFHDSNVGIGSAGIGEFWWVGGKNGHVADEIFLTGPSRCNCSTHIECYWITAHSRPDYSPYIIGTDNILYSKISGQLFKPSASIADMNKIYSFDDENFYQLWPCDPSYQANDYSSFFGSELGECSDDGCNVAQPTSYCEGVGTSLQDPDRWSTPTAYDGYWFTEFKNMGSNARQASSEPEVTVTAAAGPSTAPFQLYINRHAQSFANIITHACPDATPMTDSDQQIFHCAGSHGQGTCWTTITRPEPAGSIKNISCTYDSDIYYNSFINTSSPAHDASRPILLLNQPNWDAHITKQGILDTITAKHKASVQDNYYNNGWLQPSTGNFIIISSCLMRTIETAVILYSEIAQKYHDQYDTAADTCPLNVYVGWTKNAQEILFDPISNGEGQNIAYNLDAYKRVDMAEQIADAEAWLLGAENPNTCPGCGYLGTEDPDSIPYYKDMFRCFKNAIARDPQPMQTDWFNPYQTMQTYGMAPLFKYWTGKHWSRSRVDALLSDVQSIVQESPFSSGKILISSHSYMIAHVAVQSPVKDLSENKWMGTTWECLNPRAVESPYKLATRAVGAGGAKEDQTVCPCKFLAPNTGVYKLQYPCGFMENEIQVPVDKIELGTSHSKQWNTFHSKCEMRTCGPTSWDLEQTEVTVEH